MTVTLTVQRNPTVINVSDYAGGLIPNGAADFTIIIQSALNAASTAGGGDVVIPFVGNGNYVTSSPLTIYSNTKLTLAQGVTITLASGSNCNMLRNAASIPGRTVTDAVTTATSTTVTSATANFQAGDVGKAVGVLGAGPNYGLSSAPGSLYGTVSSVTNSTTIVLSSAATSTTSGSTLSVFPARDTNITITGGTWNHGNVDSINQTLNSMCHLFRRVDGLTIVQVKQVSSGSQGIGGRYAYNIGDCTNVFAENLTFSTGADGLHFVGPGQYIQVRGLTGTTGDDMCAFTGVDGQSAVGSLLGDVYGNFSDILVEGIQANASWTALKLTAGTGSNNVATSISRFKAKDINGSTANASAAAINIIDYGGTTTFSGDIENVNIVTPSNQPIVKITASAVSSVTLRGIKWPSGQATPSNGVINLNSPTSVLIKDLEFLYSGSTGGPIILFTGAFIRHLAIDGLSIPSAPSGAIDVLRSTGSSAQISLLRMNGIFKSGSGGGNVLSCTGTNYNIKAELENISTSSGGVFSGSADSTNTLYVTAANLQTGSASSAATLFTLQSPATLYLSNVFHTTTAAAAIIANDAAATPVRVYGSAITLSSGALFSRSATQAISGTGFGVSADLSILTPTDQDVVNNTNAGLSCGAGLCIFHTGGTGNGWKNIYSGSTY